MPIREMVDPHYGLIVLNHGDHGQVVVSGESIPTASIDLSADGDESRRSLVLDETRYELVVSKGFWRRAHRTEISGPTEHWVFAPATRRSHRLVRGHHDIESNEVGRFAAEKQQVVAQWREGPGSGSDSEPSPGECALGYLLAATYGTGTPLTLLAIFQGTVNVIVPG